MVGKFAGTDKKAPMSLTNSRHVVRGAYAPSLQSSRKRALCTQCTRPKHAPGTGKALRIHGHRSAMRNLEFSSRSSEYVLMWLAFSYRSMTLEEECAAITRLVGLDHFDLERALQRRRLASFVKIADSPDRTVSPTEAQDMDEWPALGVAEQGVHTVASNDNILPLRFQERSMRQFFRDAKLGEIGLRTPASLAHQKIFHTCALLICQSGSDVPVGLKKYAARYWAMHLNSIKMEELRESDVAAALDALGGIMSNEHNVAAGTIETLGVEYQHLVSSPSEPQNDLPRQMMLYARLAQNPPRKVSTLATTWAKTASSDGLSAFMLLAEGHVRNWLSSEDLKSALQSYRFARSALKLVSGWSFPCA